MILLSEQLMKQGFYSVKSEFKDFAYEEMEKLGKKLDQGFRSGINHLIERCQNLAHFPNIEKELELFRDEQELLA